MAPGGPENTCQARILVENAGNVGEAARLVAEVVDRNIAAGRVLDADRVVQEFAGGVIIDLANASAPFGARLKPRVRAAIHGGRAAWVQRPGLGLDVDDAGGAQPVLRGQSAGDQRHRVGEPRLQDLSEEVDPLR